jgi:glycosyltransferase involved in cell wall biosynthesis
MHAVIVDGDISYPPTSGKRLRTLNLLLPLAKRHRLTYIGRGDATSADAKQAVAFLEDHGICTRLVDHPLPHKSGPLFYARLAANLLSPLPYSVASHRSAPMREAVGAYAAAHKVDVWQFEWTGYVDTLRAPGAKKVVIAHNVDSLIWQRYEEAEKNTLKRLYIGRQRRKFERFERRVFHEATRVVAVSDADARLLREQFGVENADVVDNGIDRAFFEQVQRRPDPKRILFLGALDWRPNLDALKQLLDDIMPRVRQQEASAKLCIVGRCPPAWLRERTRDNRAVELHADVPDVRPYLAECGVMTVPLRIGGGSRLKILEALASNMPVISTRIGAEGLHLAPGRDYELADDVEQLAAALIDSIRRPARHQAMAENGRAVVRERYDWTGLAEKLERVWEACVVEEARRLRPLTPTPLPQGARGTKDPPRPLGERGRGEGPQATTIELL